MTTAPEPAAGDVPSSPDSAPNPGQQSGNKTVDDGFGHPFVHRSFGGEFVWAEAEHYTAKILRVRSGEKVAVSTKGRKDMIVMLTGGRALLEVHSDDDLKSVELGPGMPTPILPEFDYRLVAMTEVEMFTIYSPL